MGKNLLVFMLIILFIFKFILEERVEKKIGSKNPLNSQSDALFNHQIAIIRKYHVEARKNVFMFAKSSLSSVCKSIPTSC